MVENSIGIFACMVLKIFLVGHILSDIKNGRLNSRRENDKMIKGMFISDVEASELKRSVDKIKENLNTIMQSQNCNKDCCWNEITDIELYVNNIKQTLDM